MSQQTLHICHRGIYTTRRALTPPDASYTPDTSGPDTSCDGPCARVNDVSGPFPPPKKMNSSRLPHADSVYN